VSQWTYEDIIQRFQIEGTSLAAKDNQAKNTPQQQKHHHNTLFSSFVGVLIVSGGKRMRYATWLHFCMSLIHEQTQCEPLNSSPKKRSAMRASNKVNAAGRKAKSVGTTANAGVPADQQGKAARRRTHQSMEDEDQQLQKENEEKAAAEEIVDDTTRLLLEIKNMSEKEIGIRFREVREEEQVKNFCKNTLFHKVKFVVNKYELGSLSKTHDIGNFVMNGLNVTDESVKPRFWLVYQDVAKRTLDTQRSNCNMAIKNVMIGACLNAVVVCHTMSHCYSSTA
jgi:hypothetical protein